MSLGEEPCVLPTNRREVTLRHGTTYSVTWNGNPEPQDLNPSEPKFRTETTND